MLGTGPNTQYSLKTMVPAIVIISISVIPEGRPHWARGQGGWGNLAGMPQGPAATQAMSSWAASTTLPWALPPPTTCSKPYAETPSCPSMPHLHPQVVPVKLVSTPCPGAHRAKLQGSTPFSPCNSAASFGPPSLNCLEPLAAQGALYQGISLGHLLSPGTGGLLSSSQRPNPPSTSTGAQGSACLINEVPWQPGSGRVEDGRWKDRQREGISSWPSHPAPAEKASQPGGLSPEARRARPAPGSPSIEAGRRVSSAALPRSGPRTPPLTSLSSHAHHPATHSGLKPAGLSSNLTCSLVTRGQVTSPLWTQFRWAQ